jgi:predicted NBD/HSP70 family sugar kinase
MVGPMNQRIGEPEVAAPPGSLEALKETNRQRVIAVLREKGAASRADISRVSGLSRSTVSNVVSDLITAGLAREGAEARPASGGTGRPAVPVLLDPSAGAALGIEIGHDGVRAVVCDLAHTILAEERRVGGLEKKDAEAVISLAVRVANEALEEAGVSVGRLVGAAASVPSPVDPTTGIVGSEAVVLSLAGLPLGEMLGSKLGVQVQVENDANLGALGESFFGSGAGHETLVFVKLSRGIGAGLIIGGKLHRGLHGGAGELGHTPVLPEGPVCRCGNRGCLEVVAGSRAVLDHVASRFAKPPTIADVVALALEGDTLCRRAFRDAGGVVGTALATVCNLLNPSAIIIGGEMAAAWRFMEAPLHEALDRAAIHSSAIGVTVMPSTLGPRAEVLGAVAAVLRQSERLTAAD